MPEALASYDAMLCTAMDARVPVDASAAPLESVSPTSDASAASEGGEAGGDASAVPGIASATAAAPPVRGGGAAGAGDAPAAPRGRARQEAPELPEPFVAVPLATPATGPARVAAPPVARAGAAPALRMPRQLDIVPAGKADELSPELRGYPRAFADTAAAAERLYAEIVGAGMAEHERTRSLYDLLAADAQQALDRDLGRLDARLDDARHDLARGERDATDRLALAAGNARKLIRTAAASALGTVAARRGVIERRIGLARSAASDIEGQLAFYAGEIDRAGPLAASAFTGLGGNLQPALAPNDIADNRAHEPQLSAAENEPLRVALPPRISERATAFTSAHDVFAGNLATAHQGFQAAAREAFQPFQHYIDQLGTAAPRQIAAMRRNAIAQVDRTERQSRDAAKRSRNQVEASLIDRHRRGRGQLIDQARRGAEMQSAAIGRGAHAHRQTYLGLAQGQGAAIEALRDTIAGQRRQQPDGFARYVLDAAARTRERQRDLADARLGQAGTAGERLRQGFRARADAVLDGQGRGAGAAADQLAASARSSSATMLAQVVALEAGLRRSGEPVARVIDSFPIPAAAELQRMEELLWQKLGTAREQAQAAWSGNRGPPSETHGASAPASTAAQPPQGTGTSPQDFVQTADRYAAAPQSEEGVASLTRTVASGVVQDVQHRGDGLVGQMDLLAQNPEQTIDLVRGLTYLRGQAVIKYYGDVRGGRSLTDDIATYMSFGNPLTGFDTRVHSGTAVYNYLYGNNAAGALAEVQAATEWWNNGERVQQAMLNLTPADLEAMRGLPGAAAVLGSVEADLEGADRRVFHILRAATAENAVESAAAARAVRLGVQIEEALATDPERGADNAFDLAERAAQAAGSSRLEGGGEFGMAADYRYETPDQAEERRRSARDAAWNETVARLGNDGERRTGGAAAGVEWLRATASRERLYGDGDTMYAARVRPDQVRLLTNLARFGAGAPETRAAQLAVEDSRTGGAKRERVEHALWDDDLNAGAMANPDGPRPAPDSPVRTPEAEARARAREEAMLRAYDRYRHPERAEEAGRTTAAIRGDLGATLRRGHPDDPRLGRLLELQVTRGLTDPGVAALAFEHAIDRAGTDEQLLRDTFGRMTRDQIRDAVERYNSTHPAPGLYERLGLFDHRNDWFAELSGDDRIQMQTLAMGRPRNDRERGEVARMTSRLQLDNAGWAGRLLAGEEYRRLESTHARMLRMMGVREGDDPARSDFDAFGNLRVRTIDGRRVRVGRFAEDGSFQPPAGESAMAFAEIVAHNESNAEAYRQATDNIANAITTTLVVAAAVVSTVLTGGAAASIWIPVLTTAGAGLLGMAVNWSVKGGRYGYEDAGRDFALTVVQSVTAGLSSGMTIARAGGATALRGAMGARMISNAGFRTVGLAEEAVIGGVSSAIGGMGNAALDDRAWDSGEWLSGIGRGAERGCTGGFLSGLATGLTTRGITLGVSGAGRAAGAAEALARGRSGIGARDLSTLRAQAAAESFGVKLLSRTAGGGVGGAASRWAEIDYDRRRGRYAGSHAEAYDEIFAAGAQNAIQSLSEGVAEHGFEHHAGLQRWRERAIGATGPPAVRQMVYTHAPYGPGTMVRPVGEGAEAPPAQPLRAATPDEAPLRIRPLDEEQAARPVRQVELPAHPPATPEAVSRAAPGTSEQGPLSPTRKRPVLVRTADDDGASAPPTPANDNAAEPFHGRIALDEHSAAHADVGAVYVHPDTRSFDAANANFERLLAADPTREAAVYHNPVTGDYVVVQGNGTAIAVIHPDGTMEGHGATGRMVTKDGVLAAGGHWILEQHYHPNAPGERGTRFIRRLPSGKDGDFGVVDRELGQPGQTQRRSRIYFDDNGARSFTDFGIEPGHPDGAYWVNFLDPETGTRTQRHFESVGAYDVFLGMTKLNTARARAGGNPHVSMADAEPSPPAALRPGSSERQLTAHDRASITAAIEHMGLIGAARDRIVHLVASADVGPDIPAAWQHHDFLEMRARSLVHQLGLVGQADSMARLHLLLNSLPEQHLPLGQILLEQVVEATRLHRVAQGTMRPDEELMLILHGAVPKRAASIRSQGIDLSQIPSGSADDFALALYFTENLHTAREEYAQRHIPYGTAPSDVAKMPRGEVFPFLLSESEMGTVIDVRRTSAIRRAWEQHGAANYERFLTEGYMIDGKFVPVGGEGRGEMFNDFLVHLAALRNDPRLTSPDFVQGDLDSDYTAGIGTGSQQAVRTQALADFLNRQLGFLSPKAFPPAPSPRGPIVRTADDDGEAPTLRLPAHAHAHAPEPEPAVLPRRAVPDDSEAVTLRRPAIAPEPTPHSAVNDDSEAPTLRRPPAILASEPEPLRRAEADDSEAPTLRRPSPVPEADAVVPAQPQAEAAAPAPSPPAVPAPPVTPAPPPPAPAVVPKVPLTAVPADPAARAAHALRMVVEMVPAARAAEKFNELMGELNPHQRGLLVEFLSAPDQSGQFLVVQRMRRTLRDQGHNSTHVELMTMRMAYVHDLLGAQFRQTLSHLNTLAATAMPSTPSTRLHHYMLESPLTLHMAQTHRAMLDRFLADFEASRTRTGWEAKHFESYLHRRLKAPNPNPADEAARITARNELGALFPWVLASTRSGAPEVPLRTTGGTVLDSLGYRSGDRRDSGDLPIGPHRPPVQKDHPPIAPEEAIVPGQRVHHPDRGTGTILKIVNGIAHVDFDAGGAPSEVAMAAGELFHARDPMTGALEPVVPIRSGDSLKAELDAVHEFRRDEHLVEYDENVSDTGTAAIARVGDRRFYGTNTNMPTGRTILTSADHAAVVSILIRLGLAADTANLQTDQHVTHAEFAALFHASRELGSFPPVVELFVDRPTCSYCSHNLDAIAAYFGIAELRVYFIDQEPPVPTLIKARRR